MTQLSSLGDKYIDFVVQNWEDIVAFEHIYGYAKTKLPRVISSLICDIITNMGDELHNKYGLEYCENDDDKSAISWYSCKFYDKGKDIGPYFNFDRNDSLKWENLIAENKENSPYLCIYVDVDNVPQNSRKKYVNQFFEHLGKNMPDLIKKGVEVVQKIDYNNPYLAYYYLDIGIKDLRDIAALTQKIQDAVRQFTGAAAPILLESTQIGI